MLTGSLGVKFSAGFGLQLQTKNNAAENPRSKTSDAFSVLLLTLLHRVSDGSSCRANLCRSDACAAGNRRHAGTQVDQPTACRRHGVLTARHAPPPSGQAVGNRDGRRDDLSRGPVQVGALFLRGRVVVGVVEHALAAALRFPGRGRRDGVEAFGSGSSART